MPPKQPDIAQHISRFLTMLETAFARYGVQDGLPASIRDAVQATPRHRFVHRFRLGDGPLQDLAANLTQQLPTIYSDAVMRHVDTDGAPLPSSNSQPSYILWLLHMLDPRPGHRVLEIGSGSGWLAAIMARLVGHQGHVTGMEIIPGLADQSRADLAALGLDNVAILTRDGTSGHPDGAPFDRVIITAATWDLPAVLFDQVTEGGYVLVPIELRGTGGCQVTLLRRTGPRFVAERSVPGWFVPLVGAGQTRPDINRTLDSLPFWSQVQAAPSIRCKLPLGFPTDGQPPSAVVDFRAFLARTEPGFAIFDSTRNPPTPNSAFGVVDETASAVALWQAGQLLGYGSDTAARRLASAFARWASFGLPPATAFQLEICRTEATPPETSHLWVEPRQQTALLWSLPPEATAWRSLLEDTSPTIEPLPE